MTLDDLKNIDVNNLSSWPVPIKIASILIVCVIILFAGYWFLIQGEIEEYGSAQQKEVSLRDTYLNKKGLAVNLPAYKQQMEEMEQTFGSLLRQLPNTTEVPDLLVDITQAGLGRGLEFTLFRPEKELPKDFYAEMPISVQVRGNYHELALFVSDVASLPRIVTFGDINITSTGKDNKLTMSAKAKTYRYLEEGSVAKPVSRPRGRR
ncbi:MAG: type 4a pilus biogenesis protein PilO [Gammaproteobacteria bacterium]|nr:type 4a pilus biogenesis protein PilO [Gammaproteobacteria bacterium]MDH3371196.1 type 4a pilus biogenesis protein PilO [Gammaproteobacteria bacterium]MDH3406178.1 type 4a pilus biogenesis protein PilO [Gammaproteobacteria bacterium]MDH3563378.1 type 4a pilus biogenesis protein PilO [Gammaproteobacteria bacterium]MDH5485948.1 type 4a pilus biogenesis protein PilO [Gammaproteobacteria bacterium]